LVRENVFDEAVVLLERRRKYTCYLKHHIIMLLHVSEGQQLFIAADTVTLAKKPLQEEVAHCWYCCCCLRVLFQVTEV